MTESIQLSFTSPWALLYLYEIVDFHKLNELFMSMNSNHPESKLFFPGLKS